MLSPKAIATLAKLAKLTPEQLTAEINKAEAVDLAIDESLTALTEAELTARDAQMKGEGEKAGQKSGKVAGLEIGAKLIAKQFSIDGDFKGDDAINQLLPKVQDLVKGESGLKTQVEALLKDKTTLQTQLDQEKSLRDAAVRDAELITLLPQNRSTTLSTSEHLLLVKSGLEQTDEGVKNKVTGEIYRDPTTKAPLSMQDALKSWYEGKKSLLAEPPTDDKKGGRGGSDDGKPAPAGGSVKAMRIEYQKQNPGKDPLQDPQFLASVKEAAQKDATFSFVDDGADA